VRILVLKGIRNAQEVKAVKERTPQDEKAKRSHPVEGPEGDGPHYCVNPIQTLHYIVRCVAYIWGPSPYEAWQLHIISDLII